MIRPILLLLACVACRLDAVEGISVSAHVVATRRAPGGAPALVVVEAVVKNTSTSKKTLGMFTCSWGDSWFAEPNQKFQAVGPLSCDSNFPMGYDFTPGSGFTFRFWVLPKDGTAMVEGSKFKVGFLVVPWTSTSFGDDSPWLNRSKKTNALPIAWSDWITLPQFEPKTVSQGEYEPARTELPSRK